ncbi:MAG: hypothetical protein U1F24_07355 [Alphaproteobacteria bacterium]
MRNLIAAILAVSFAGAAAADDTEAFSVQGTAPDGSPYSGSVTLTELHFDRPFEGDAFDVVWTIGGETIQGVGIVDGANRDVLAISYVYAGAPGVSIMTHADGVAKGVWYVKGTPGAGTEVWTPADNPEPPGAAAPAATEITYERAVACSAATSFVTGTLRATPGADPEAIKKYDAANSAWIVKLGEVGKDKPMSTRIADVKAKQQEWAADPDGMAKATALADECVASAPPM